MIMKALATGCVLVLTAALLAPPALASDVGRRFPPERRTMVDARTGVTITALTTAPANDAKIYQTHPQWSADGRYIIFRSDRAASGTQAFAVNEVTGEIIQLTDGPGTGTGSLNIARKSSKLYFFRGGRTEGARLVEVNLDPLFADSEAGKMKDPASYERVITTLPAELRESGGFALDADEKVAYVGVRRLTPDEVQAARRAQSLGQAGQQGRRRAPGEPILPVPGGIRSINLQTGEIKTVIDTPFTMGHVQANPWASGEIIYCNETGGDAPQRMWFVRSDGTGNRPLYKETPDEWVTHEVVVDRDLVMFNIMGHLPRLRTKPTGIAVINLRNDEMRIIGQVEEGQGFWHCNGSADGRWAVGDNFTGNIYLIDRLTGETTLLSTGHIMRPDHAHPTFSPDGKRILIQSGLLSNGASLDLIVIPIPLSLQSRR